MYSRGCAGASSDGGRREAKLLASLNHPNIAALHDIGEESGSLYIAMELVEGETLRGILRQRPLPVAEALRLGGEIAEALARALAASVIHRDLKPENVIVRQDGKAKVLDFGLARHLAPAPGPEGGAAGRD